MPSAEELRKIYVTLDREEKLIFLDGLVEILQRREDSKASEYDSAKSPGQRIALLTDSVELRQLINSVKNQKKATRKNPGNEAQELWQSIEKFFESV